MKAALVGFQSTTSVNQPAGLFFQENWGFGRHLPDWGGLYLHSLYLHDPVRGYIAIGRRSRRVVSSDNWNVGVLNSICAAVHSHGPLPNLDSTHPRSVR